MKVHVIKKRIGRNKKLKSIRSSSPQINKRCVMKYLCKILAFNLTECIYLTLHVCLWYVYLHIISFIILSVCMNYQNKILAWVYLKVQDKPKQYRHFFCAKVYNLLILFMHGHATAHNIHITFTKRWFFNAAKYNGSLANIKQTIIKKWVEIFNKLINSVFTAKFLLIYTIHVHVFNWYPENWI